MAAPHGACSEGMLEQLPKCGFESATISHGSLRAHNKDKAWTRQMGFAPSEWIQDCPVLPRWRLAAGAQNTILLAAYLQQAMILVGHHGDLKDGIAVMDELAGFINALGSVHWQNMAELSRANYRYRKIGETLKLQPFGRKLALQVPDSVTRLVVELPCGGEPGRWSVSSQNGSILQTSDGDSVLLPAGKGRLIVCEKNSGTAIAANGVSTRPALKALVRRLATEGRDRIKASLG